MITISSPFAQFGIVGALVTLLLGAIGVLWRQSEAAHKREQERCDRLETELNRVLTDQQEKYLTTIAAATGAMQEVLILVRGKGL